MSYNPSDPDYKPIVSRPWNPSDPGYSMPGGEALKYPITDTFVLGHTSKTPSDAFYEAWDALSIAISAVVTATTHNLTDRVEKLEAAKFAFQQALREFQ